MQTQGTDWTLNVKVEDKDAKESLNKLEKELEDIVKIDFAIFEQNLESVLKLIKSFPEAVNPTIASIDKLVKSLSDVRSGAGAKIEPVITQTSVTAPPPVISTIIPKVNLRDLESLIIAMKSKVGKDSALFKVRPVLEKSALEGLKTELKALGLATNIKINFSEKDASGVIASLVTTFDRLNERLRLYPITDPASLLQIEQQISKVLSKAVEVLGPELKSAVNRADLSEFYTILKQYGIEGIESGVETGIGNTDVSDISKKVEDAVEDGLKHVDAATLEKEIEDSISQAILNSLDETDKLATELKEKLNLSSIIKPELKAIIDTISNARVGENIAEDIRKNVNAMRSNIASAFNIDDATVKKVFNPWQSHLTRMSNDLARLTGDAFKKKQESLTRFVGDHIGAENIRVKLNIDVDNLSDIDAQVTQSTKSVDMFNSSVVKAKLSLEELADFKLPTSELKELEAGFDQISNSVPELTGQVETLRNALQYGIGSNEEFDAVNAAFDILSEKVDNSTDSIRVLNAAEDKLASAHDILAEKSDALNLYTKYDISRNSVEEYTDRIYGLITGVKQLAEYDDFDPTLYEEMKREWVTVKSLIQSADDAGVDLGYTIDSLTDRLNQMVSASSNKKLSSQMIDADLAAEDTSASLSKLQGNVSGLTKGFNILATKANVVKGVKLAVSLAAWSSGFAGLDVLINHVIDSVVNLNTTAKGSNALKNSLIGTAAAATAAVSAISMIRTHQFPNIFATLKSGADMLTAAAKELVTRLQYVGNTASQLSMAGIGLMFIQQWASSTIGKAMQDQSDLGDAIVNTALLIKQEYGSSIQEAEKVTVDMLNTVTRTASNSRDELAKAMQSTVQAGFAKPEELKAMMDFADATATATNTKNVSNIAKMLGGLVFAFNKDISAAKQFGDEFAVALNKTSLEAEDLATVVNYTVGQTASLGLEFSDLLTYAAILRKGGMEPSSIGTSIRSLLIDVSSMKGELGKFIKSEGIGIPKGIEQYSKFADQYGAILEKRKQAAIKLQELEAKKLNMKGAGANTDAISKQIIALKGQIASYDVETNKLNVTYKDVAQNAVKFFGDVFKAIGNARKEGRITEEQFNKMFDTVQSTAANVFSNSFSTQEDYIKDLNKAIKNSAGYSDQIRADKLDTVKGRTQKIQNEYARLMGLIYTSFSKTLTKIGELLFKYGPEMEKIFSTIAAEIEKLGGIIYSIIDKFVSWFASLSDTQKAFVVNKALIIALIGLIGGPLMVYIGAVGSALAGFSQTLLGLSGFLGGATRKLLDFFISFLLGSQAGSVPLATTTLGKFNLMLQVIQKTLAGTASTNFFSSIIAGANAKSFQELAFVIRGSLSNILAYTRSHTTSMAACFINFGSGLKSTFSGIGSTLKGFNIVSLLGSLRGAIFGVATALPVLSAGIASTLVVAAPYVAVIIAIIGALYLLYRAWRTNFGGIQDIVSNAGGAILGGLKTLYDGIMMIIGPIVRAIDTVGQFFMKIFDAFGSGNIGNAVELAKELSNSLIDIMMDALESIGSAIYNVIGNFFGETADFIDNGGLEAIGGAIINFLATVVITTATILTTIVRAIVTKIIPIVVKELIRGLMDLELSLAAFITNIGTDIYHFITAGIFESLMGFINGIVQALPLPKSWKDKIAKSYDLTKEYVAQAKIYADVQKNNTKVYYKEAMKRANANLDKMWVIDGRTDEQRKKGRAEGEAYKDGINTGLSDLAGDVQKDVGGLLNMGQVNPFSAAETSTANIRDNLTGSMSKLQEYMDKQDKIKQERVETMNAYIDLNEKKKNAPVGSDTSKLDAAILSLGAKISSYNLNYNDLAVLMWNSNRSHESRLAAEGQTWVETSMQPSVAVPMNPIPQNLSYVQSLPPSQSSAYTVNIGELNVETPQQAQEYLSDPVKVMEKPVVNTGVNVGV